MKAVVLAGGVRSGEELPGANLPRALWPFPSEPLISGVLRFLVRSGVDDIAVCANGKTRLIAAELASGREPWLDLHYSEDVLPRGPAGCLKDLEGWLGDAAFVAIQGTGAYRFDLRPMIEAHQDGGAAVTVAARACGREALEPAGVFVMNPAVLRHVNPVGFQDIKEQLLPRVIETGERVACHRIAGAVSLIHGCGHYVAALEALLQSGDFEIPPGMTQRGGGVWVHERAHVAEEARISGPAWIDADAVVEPGAVLVGPVLLGPGAQVGRGAVVNRAVLMRSASVSAGGRLSGAVAPPGACCGVAAPAARLASARPSSRGRERAWASPARAAMGLLSMARRGSLARAQ